MLRVLSPFLWIAGVFSHQKSFRGNPIIGSTLLNRAGLHVARVLAARAAYRLRCLVLAPLVPRADRRALAKDGYVVKRDFLAREEFESLCREVDRLQGRVHEMVEGDTLTERIFVDSACVAKLPTLRRVLADRRRTALVRYATSKNRVPLIFVENLLRRFDAAGDTDPQSVPHRDTFHPTIKGWLFLDDVTDENGPFCYLPGSHRVTRERLRWEYRRSVDARALMEKGIFEDGAFRYRDGVDALGSGPPIRFTVPANTLVVADTFGIHWRGPAAGRSRRRAIWFQSRDNPFSPLITPLPSLTRRINEVFVKRYLARFDRAVDGRPGERVHRGQLTAE